MAERAKKRPEEAKILYRTTVMKKKILDERVRFQNLTLNDFIDQAISLRSAWPLGAYEDIERLANEMHLPIATVVFHKIAKQTAWEYAWLKVFGKSAPSTSMEFRFDGNRLVTGNELLLQLVEEFEKILTKAKAKVQPVDRNSEMFSATEMESLIMGLKSEVN